MTVPALASAPVLSTPDTHMFEDPTPVADTSTPRLSDAQVARTYEIGRTVREIREGRWSRIALQFPDQMLGDAPRVVELLGCGLARARRARRAQGAGVTEGARVTEGAGEGGTAAETNMGLEQPADDEERLFILGDTSYGACCVDEVAAEHVDADCVVHYGRSCLSPPSRLSVVYVFTERPLDLDQTVATFQATYPDPAQKVILMADIPYAHHIPALTARLYLAGYTSLFPTDIVHNPASLLPNRTTPPVTAHDKAALLDWALFHISEPPTSLLLTLSSRVASTHIYPTTPSATPPTAEVANTRMTLRRRYALCTSLSTAPVFGILINTLSVKNYMSILAHVQQTIAAAGKKSYTFVVGKVNAAKVANFSEIAGWVVIGCWESSLIESKDFWRPLITPFELEIALQDDANRVWTGEWSSDFSALLAAADAKPTSPPAITNTPDDAEGTRDADEDSDSAPPEFDLRTGRYVSHSRPMQPTRSLPPASSPNATASPAPPSSALARRANGALARVNGVVSPGAEFLRSGRTWVGLGSDFGGGGVNGKGVNGGGRGEGVDGRDGNDGANGANGANGNGHAARMEEGRSGIARGYRVG
ncbi:diphthamide biosynthesis protein, partial [Lizonia empirigonia]